MRQRKREGHTLHAGDFWRGDLLLALAVDGFFENLL